jgi:hypothetical protein
MQLIVPSATARAVQFVSPVPKPQKIADLAFPPAMILGRERIGTGIDANIADIELSTLNKVRAASLQSFCWCRRDLLKTRGWRGAPRRS